MKRFLAILLVLVLLAGAAYHAYDYIISRPDIKNLDKVKENLENAEYSVTLLDSEEDLAGGFLPDGIVKYLMATNYDSEEDNVLLIAEFEDRELARIYYKEMKNQIDSTIESTKLNIDRLEYELDHSDDLSDSEIEQIKEELEEAKEDLKEYKSLVIGREGKIFWYGTLDAVKASRG